MTGHIENGSSAQDEQVPADKEDSTTPFDAPGVTVGVSRASDSANLHEESEAWVLEHTAQLKETDRALGAARQRFFEVLEALPAYLILLTPDRRISFANRFFREHFGEVRDGHCYEYLFGRTEPCETCEAFLVLQTGAPHRWEWMGPDGRIYDIYDTPFVDTDGSPLIMEMGIDITEKKQVELELTGYRSRLEELVRERTDELEKANARLRLEIAERTKAEKELKAAYEREQHIAEVLQKAIIPTEPSIGEGYSISACYIPGLQEAEVGGDFYDVYRLGDDQVGILIGDVSGKGVEAASQAAATRNAVRALSYGLSSPASVLSRSNDVLCEMQPDGAFVTAYLAFLDEPTGTVTYASAGHPPSAILRSDSTVEFPAVGDLPLGIIKDHEYGQGEFQLRRGDYFILYTDGVEEASREGCLFGMPGIAEVARRCVGKTPQHIRDALLHEVRAWARGDLRDDAAIVVIKRL